MRCSELLARSVKASDCAARTGLESYGRHIPCYGLRVLPMRLDSCPPEARQTLSMASFLPVTPHAATTKAIGSNCNYAPSPNIDSFTPDTAGTHAKGYSSVGNNSSAHGKIAPYSATTWHSRRSSARASCGAPTWSLHRVASDSCKNPSHSAK